MRKRVLSLLLAACMTFSVLPATAYAAVGELLGNSPAQNQMLLEQLSALTGGDAQAVYDVLEQYGLLDENGQLKTDQTVDLNGKTYTLEEMETLLGDPGTDLGQIGYVDGVPIALGDLKTIIAIEREMARIQETYFSGKAFEGESLTNLSSLMAHLQSEGITLNAGAVNTTAVVDVSNFTSVKVSEIKVNDSTFWLPEDAVLSVDVRLDPGLVGLSTVSVWIGTEMIELTPNQPSATLVYHATEAGSVGIGIYADADTAPEYAYGQLAGAVQFSNAKGFVFQNGNDYSDSHTVRVTKDVEVPDLSTWWEDDNWDTGYNAEGGLNSPIVSEFNFPILNSSDRGSSGSDKAAGITAQDVNAFIALLQGAKGLTEADQVSEGDFVYFTVSGTLVHITGENPNAYVVPPDVWGSYTRNAYFLPSTDYDSSQTADRVELNGNYGFRYANWKSGGENSFELEAYTKLGTNAVPDKLVIVHPFKQAASGFLEKNSWQQIKSCRVELTNDKTAPKLTAATAPSATYRPGQLVPVTLAFDELVYVNDNASIVFNGGEANGGVTLNADQLHMSKAGNQILLWYPVQKVDGAQVTITSCSGITDIFGNEAVINGETATGATLESALYRDAATGVSAEYDAVSGMATTVITLDGNTAYKTKYNNYHQPTDGSPKELPFRAVVTGSNGVIATEQVYVNEDGETFSTQPFAVTPQTTEQTYTVTLQVNEGTREDSNWQDLSYRTDLKDTFTVAALIPADKVEVTPESDEKNYTLSLADTVRPTLTAKVYGPDGTTLATHQSGKWSSSDPDIATISTESDYSGKVALTGQKIGTVTFTFTADNGTPDDPSDKTGTSETYTVTAGDSLALVIPEGASTIVARQNTAATILWSSNAALFAPDKDFSYTIELFEGNFATETELTAEPVWKTTATKDQNSVQISEDVLNELSSGNTPAYTVRVSMPHPNGSGDDVRLSALAWIVVRPEPAQAQLIRPESIYWKDSDGSVSIGWTAENLTEGGGQTVTLTILRVTEDNTSTEICNEIRSGPSGTYPLQLAKVADGYLKDTYQVMLRVDNPGEAPSTDSFPLYVYNGDALKIVDSGGNQISTLTLDNAGKVSGNLPTSTAEILAMRQELGLLDFIGINYGDYSWNSFKDGIAWATDNDAIAVNYKQGGLYENIKNFSFSTYLPEVQMGISSVEGGTAKVTATHAATGMTAEVTVTANTLRDKFYLFQVTPAAETTLRYQDGTGAERTVKTNSEGVLALYEPNGIASDVWLSSETGDTEYMGTIYRQDLQSGERDATKLQLYPLNTFRLREAAKAELTFALPGGAPLANTDVTVRGGVFKNGSFCETAGLGTSRGSIGAAGENQQDTTFTTDENGKIIVYFDATQFWSQAAGESAGTVVSPVDKIQYVLEIRDIVNNTYYPVFQVVNGSVSVQQEMRTAAGVVVLEEVSADEANKPFVARQTIDYDLPSGELVDVRHSTGFVGPNNTFKQATLTTTMLLWGQTGEAKDYSLAVVDEFGYTPKEQSRDSSRYPFASMIVVENTMTLNEETMTTSGWIPDGKDVGLKTRLTKDNALVQERTMPFRTIDLTRVIPVNEDENVTQMLVTMQGSSILKGVDFGNVGGSNILKTLTGRLDDLSGPVNGSVFKMLIAPSEDPTVFNAIIWTGYNTLGLEDVEYSGDGVAISGNFLSQNLEANVPGVGDISEMAQGTYNPSASIRENKNKTTITNTEVGLQLEGYYEAEIRYNRDTQKWEVFTKGGGFTAGAGVGFGFDVNAMAGPVPVTGSFEAGGAVQLDFKAAVRYSQQGAGLEWSDPSATAVTDYLTNLRLNAYVKAFGGVGFDYSIIALKIGLFGELDVDSQNRFLSRTYLSDSSKQQLNGQALSIQSEVGIKFVAEFLAISYEAVLASGQFGATKSFNDWKTIDDYWNSANTGLSTQSLQAMATQSGLRVAASSATLQDRDYLETYARTWGNPLRSFALFSLDEPSGVEYLQNNANPASYPELSDDGQLLVYISDSDSQSIYDSRAHFSTLSGSSYAPSTEISHPADFEGYGDSNVDVAGTQSFAAAAWVRLNTDLPGKDADDPVTAVDQNLLMNGTEIVASIYNGSGWTSARLTENATPDLAPAVASDGAGRAVVFWRSVYSAGPEEDLMGFAARDQIMYSVYNGAAWSEAKILYNGSSGSVKALQAAMLPDGTAMAVYTLDRSQTGNISDYEIGYTIVDDTGIPGASMIATSDTWLDENPQVIAADFGGGDHRFVIGWHSLRSETGDIQLLAVDEAGAMSNTFPASLSAITSTGDASVSGDFRFATLSGGYGVDDLTIIWSEQVSDRTNEEGLTAAAHSVLKAARLLRDNSGYRLSAPLELAELPANNLVNHFSAYISGEDQVKAVIQATYYDNENTETINGVVVPGEKAMLYTATSDFDQYGVEVENIGVDYENLMTNSLTPIQFTIRNTGIKDLSGLTVTMADGETAGLETVLKPNESAVLTVYHKVGDTVADQSYTISGNQLSSVTGTVYLDYPDIGIARMEVLKEEAGKRTVSMTLYNASGATLAGNKEREVKLALYTDNLFTQPANVTCAGDGVAADKNILTISGGDALKRIDEGSFTLELTYDVGGYVTTVLGQKEIPSSGVYLYADAWAEGKVGEQSTAQRLPEYRGGNNQAAVSLTGAYARTGDKTTLDVVQTNADVTTATITLRNNCLQALDTGTLEATLLDASGQPLETKTTSISGNLPGETAQISPITFSQLGSRVVVHTMTGEDSLCFDGLPVSMDDFVLGEDGTLTYALSEVSADGTFVTAVSGSGEKVAINGKEFTGSGNLYVPIGAGETVIIVTIGTKIYSLHIMSTHAGASRYKITVEASSGGKVETGQSTAHAGMTVTLTTKPDEGYRLATLTVTDKNGKTITLNDKGDGKYTFTMPSSNVTVKATFAEITAGDLPFVDVPSGIWYEDGVRYVYKHGLMKGTSATTFAPDMTTTRSMIATILWRMEGSPVVDDAVAFDDVNLDSWYGEAVRWAAKEGIVTGYGNNKFGPDDPITREQMATMLHRYASYKGHDVSAGENVNLLSYTDLAELGEYAVSAMQWAVADGIINGTSSSTLSPSGNATRSQIAVILMRYCEKTAE